MKWGYKLTIIYLNLISFLIDYIYIFKKKILYIKIHFYNINIFLYYIIVIKN
jgi:hypothetical protein